MKCNRSFILFSVYYNDILMTQLPFKPHVLCLLRRMENSLQRTPTYEYLMNIQHYRYLPGNVVCCLQDPGNLSTRSHFHISGKIFVIFVLLKNGTHCKSGSSRPTTISLLLLMSSCPREILSFIILSIISM